MLRNPQHSLRLEPIANDPSATAEADDTVTVSKSETDQNIEEEAAVKSSGYYSEQEWGGKKCSRCSERVR